ncbi:hypothetical protein AB837_00598 [bacterium AB1]|nr:hypothetical protein AB837_00598 [bacterium AB1]
MYTQDKDHFDNEIKKLLNDFSGTEEELLQSIFDALASKSFYHHLQFKHLIKVFSKSKDLYPEEKEKAELFLKGDFDHKINKLYDYESRIQMLERNSLDTYSQDYINELKDIINSKQETIESMTSVNPEQDHTECQSRIKDLNDQLKLKDLDYNRSQDRFNALSEHLYVAQNSKEELLKLLPMMKNKNSSSNSNNDNPKSENNNFHTEEKSSKNSTIFWLILIILSTLAAIGGFVFVKKVLLKPELKHDLKLNSSKQQKLS